MDIDRCNSPEALTVIHRREPRESSAEIAGRRYWLNGIACDRRQDVVCGILGGMTRSWSGTFELRGGSRRAALHRRRYCSSKLGFGRPGSAKASLVDRRPVLVPSDSCDRRRRLKLRRVLNRTVRAVRPDLRRAVAPSTHSQRGTLCLPLLVGTPANSAGSMLLTVGFRFLQGIEYERHCFSPVPVGEVLKAAASLRPQAGN